jgi:predicted dehydrogenase
MKKILIFGCGNIGFRYLEAVLNISINCEIFVIEKSKKILDEKKKMISSYNFKYPNKKVIWHNALPKKIKSIDLVVIATSAKNRFLYIKKISNKFLVNSWIIEKILAQSLNQIKIIEAIKFNTNLVFVSHVRRESIFHKKIKSELLKIKKINAKLVGNNWGLASNAIHLLDLISWYTGEKLSSLDNTNLDRKWHKSKRNGYYEVSGKLFAKFSRGSKLLLECNDKSKNIFLEIVSEKSNKKFRIYESKHYYKRNFKKIDIVYDPLSKVMTNSISKVLTIGDCDLPKLKDVTYLYKIYLSSLLDSWNKSNINFKFKKLLPIT